MELDASLQTIVDELQILADDLSCSYHVPNHSYYDGLDHYPYLDPWFIERAARGPEGRHYPWGDEEPDTSRMNYDKSKVGCPTQVGVYARGAMPDGILDMAGNVWEWCSDWYDKDYYSKAASDSPHGPSTGTARVLRGGSRGHVAMLCRSAIRSRGTPERRYGDVGFRVVLHFQLSHPFKPRIARFTDRVSVALDVQVPFQSRFAYPLGG